MLLSKNNRIQLAIFSIVALVTFVSSLTAQTGISSDLEKKKPTTPKETIYTKLSYHHLQSLDPEAPQKSISPVTNAINDYNKMFILYELFHKLEVKRKNFKDPNPVLNDFCWDDLKLLCGEQDKKANLFNKINRTRTAFGAVQLQEMLATPSDDSQMIKERQNLLLSLINNNSLLEELDQKLKKIAEKENSLLSFWVRNDTRQLGLRLAVEPDLDEHVQKLLDHEKNIIQKLLDPLQKLFAGKPDFTKGKKFNTNPWLLHAKSAGINIWNFKGSLYFAFTYFALYKACKENPEIAPMLELIKKEPKKVFLFAKDYLKEMYLNLKKNSNSAALAMFQMSAFFVIFFVVPAYLLYSSLKEFKEQRRQTYLVQGLVRDCALLLDEAESLFITCNKNKILAEALPDLATTLRDITPEASKNPAIKKTRELLSSYGVRATNYFRYFTSPIGAIYASYNQLRNEKEHLAATLQLIGDIDALVSVAMYFKEMKKNKNSFCMVTIEDAALPHVMLEGFWCLMLDPNRAVPSSIELGGDVVAKNACLSGPNAGGKSTTMDGITDAIIMGQSFGIAPAKRMTLTPFSSINTYLNIKDDVAQGRSKFKMEAYRAHDLVTRIESMKKNQFVFSMMDETFSATDPREGAAAAYSIIRYLTEQAPNSMTIIASHFPLLKKLEADTNGAVKNFMIKAEINPISYPFELYEGASNQVIAIDLLEEEGLNLNKELKYARPILETTEL